MTDDDLLEMKDIVKAFNGVKALDGITLRVRRGEIVGLCGENGAGKSTLMRVLSAVYPHGTWQGQILWQGAPLEAKSPRETEAAGIVIVHQEVALVPHLSVAENIFMGNEIRRPGGVMDYEAMSRQSQALMAEFKMDDVNVALPVHHYGSGHQQLFGIARALNKRAKLLILDEPTSSLTHAETARLLELIQSLKHQGVACVLISHKLDEISAVCDTVSVIRDGTHVATRAMRDTDAQEIISLMVGRELNGRFPRKTHPIGEIVFEARHVTCFDADDPQRKRVDDVSFQLRRGEILGVAGLVGAGRTELATALFGCYAGRYHAELWLEGRPIVVDSPQAAVAHGLCLVPEDRKRHGIVPALGIGANITLAALGQFAPYGVIDDAAELAEIRQRMARMRIKAATPELPIEALSGGNQQKGVLSKMLLPKPKVLILDEPTRGIDVGAKYEIYTLMIEWVRQGMSILMISSELPEILGISDRVLVIGNGRLRGDFINDGLTQAQLIGAALGQPDARPTGERPTETRDPA